MEWILVFGRKGSWKKTEDDHAFPDKTFPRAQYKLVNARVDSIYALLKGAVTDLSGFEPLWYRSIREQSYFPNGPVPYEFTSMFFEYYCNTNYKKIVLGDETGTTVHIFINRLGWFLYQADTLDINGDGKIRAVYQLPPKDGQIQGLTVYKLRSTQSVRFPGNNNRSQWKAALAFNYTKTILNRIKNFI